MKLPPLLLRKLHDVHDDAAMWIEHFPMTVKDLETRWQIRVTSLADALTYNVIAFAESAEGIPFVLKMSPPGGEFKQEVNALRLYEGDGICHLVREDADAAAMLLERVLPGTSLWDSEDDRHATEVCAGLLQQLWRPVPDLSAYRTLENWSQALPSYLEDYPNGGPIPQEVAERANALRLELLQTPHEPVLLHGDMHHGNILSATRQAYLAIDPKGITGPRGYDIGNWLRNPYRVEERPEYPRLLADRFAIFEERLGLTRQEIAAWGYMHVALSAAWTLGESEPEIDGDMYVLERLEEYF